MHELVRTTDPVLISFIQSLLKDAGIASHVLDTHTSILEGSIGALPRRLMVPEDRADQARRLLTEADLSGALKRDG